MLKRYFFSCQLSTGNLKKKKKSCNVIKLTLQLLQLHDSFVCFLLLLLAHLQVHHHHPQCKNRSMSEQKCSLERFLGVRAAVYLLRHNDYGIQFISDRNYKNITIHFIAGALHTLHIHAVKCVLYALFVAAQFLTYFAAVSQHIDHTSSCSKLLPIVFTKVNLYLSSKTFSICW